MSIQDFLADTLEDVVSDRLYDNPDRSALDQFELRFMEQIADNRYNNETLWQIVDAMEERLEIWEDEILRKDFDRDARRNVNDFLDCLIADTLIKQKMLNDLDDRDYNFVQDVVDSPLYELMFETSRRRGRSRSSGYRDDRRESGRGRSSGYRDERRESSSRPSRGRFESRPTRDNSHEVKRSVSSNNAFSHAARIRERLEQEAVEDQPRNDRPVRDRSRQDDHEEAPRRIREPQVDRMQDDFEETSVAQVPRTGKRVFTPPPISKQGYDHTTEYPYEEFWEDNCMWQATIKTDWKLTGTGIDSYVQLYNMYKWVSYHVMDEFGNVTQRFKPMDESNRYINQSLLKDPDTFKSNFNRKPPKISDIMNTRDTVEDAEPVLEESGGYELEDMIDLSQDDLDNAGTLIPSDNLSTSAIEARTRLGETGRDSSLSVFMLMDPIETVTSQEASLIKDLYSANTLMALSKSLEGLRGKIPNASFNRINQKISNYLLDVLRNTFGVTIKQMDFSKDWALVIKGLVKRQGQDWVDKFARRANVLIPVILSFVDVEDADGNISETFDQIVTPQNRNRIVPYVDFYALVSINCTLDQLSIGKQIEEDSPLVLRAGDDIYSSSALSTVLQALDDIRSSVSINRLLLSTKCGALVNVTRHELGGSNIVLSMFYPSK